MVSRFPGDLRTLLTSRVSGLDVKLAIYPKYETKGDLKECVARLRDWLQNTVIDIEVENGTPSPTVDPSVHVFLIGHSMGGILAAEALLLLANEQPIRRKTDEKGEPEEPSIVEPGTFMFPHIQGVLAFDTPFLGIAPGVVSYGAEEQYRNATTAYNAFNEVAGIFGYGKNAGSAKASNAADAGPAADTAKTLPPTADAAAAPAWQRWGKYAMYAGAAGAVAAGGAAALYSQRQNLSAGVNWVSSHLEFVGCLARQSDLRQRLEGLNRVERDRDIRCVNFFTCLGDGASSLVQNAQPGKTSFSQKIIRSNHRTFCTLPPEVEHGEQNEQTRQPGLYWSKATNNRASDEIKAHVTMFLAKDNPAYLTLVRDAGKAIIGMIDEGWRCSRSGHVDGDQGTGQQSAGDESTDSDIVVIE
ncbi:hypothetical protein N7532_011609 [Penicillium argentinense]|uniref:DUF676 domain-containing protein n=1 Tax=Penicillium argentinense TaxID=1131581 RepID=A0A9W9EIQ3_9EURO|nr:uncharacterized protein N7532_011609 [Penicillium argentinense]KAJ5082566.1 hypothetical protein N7532_011609 [Penicillium argentinense]